MTLLSKPAEQAMPYMQKIGFNIGTISYGYSAIIQELEQRFSSREVIAYRIGFLLAGATCPDSRLRSPEELSDMLMEMKKIGLSVANSKLEPLKSAIQLGNKEQIVQSGVVILYSLASALEREAV